MIGPLGEYGGQELEGSARLVLAVIRALTWVPRRFLASARADLRRGGLSLATLGFGTPIFCVVTAPLAFAAGGAFVEAWAILLLVSIGLGLAYPLLHTGDAVRASIRPHERAQKLGRWLAASVGIIGLDLSFLAGAGNASDSSGVATSMTLIASMVVLQVGAFVWGLAGRPDPFKLPRR